MPDPTSSLPEFVDIDADLLPEGVGPSVMDPATLEAAARAYNGPNGVNVMEIKSYAVLQLLRLAEQPRGEERLRLALSRIGAWAATDRGWPREETRLKIRAEVDEALHPTEDNRKAATMARRHRLSTHLIRRTARSAQLHYEQLQHEATLDGPAGEYARKMLVDLGVGLTQQIKVERTTVERGKWRVVAE